MSEVLLRRATVFDDGQGEYLGPVDIFIEDDRIREIRHDPADAGQAQVIDCGSLVVMPGLIDAHVHAIGVSLDLAGLARRPPYLVAAEAKPILEGMLMRGFTSVRDAGGAEWGLAQATERGHFAGPRLFVSGLALAQTAGQGDFRAPGEAHLGCPVCGGLRSLTRVVDGVDEVRRAVREELRRGANQIKVMASGGMASGVPIDRCQFSLEELAVMVEEARRAGTYVMAHAYEDEAIRRCVEAGIRTIEHASALNSDTLEALVQKGTYVVPTLSVYDAFKRNGEALGFAPEKTSRFAEILKSSLESLDAARSRGIEIGHGSDLEGEMHAFQSQEFRLKREVMSSREVIRSATTTNAAILDRTGELGVVRPGALADLLIIEGDPYNDAAILAEPDRCLRAILKGGRFYKNTL